MVLGLLLSRARPSGQVTSLSDRFCIRSDGVLPSALSLEALIDCDVSDGGCVSSGV